MSEVILSTSAVIFCVSIDGLQTTAQELNIGFLLAFRWPFVGFHGFLSSEIEPKAFVSLGLQIAKPTKFNVTCR